MILDPLLDLFRGKAVTIPPMDGAFRPNTALDEARVLHACDAPDNLALLGDSLLFASGATLFQRNAQGTITAYRSFDSPVTALAVSNAGRISVALEAGAVLVIEGQGSERRFEGFSCPVALSFDGEDALYLCNGSDQHSAGHWVRDLMQKNAGGSVWRLAIKGGERTRIASGLAFPYGLLLDQPNNRLIVSESWRHQLVTIPLNGGTAQPLLTRLPGYPARLAARSNGGALLCLFAPRNRLIELVLLEDRYRHDMIADIPSEHWIAPALSASRSFLEPLQSGGVRSMGIHKPWSPTRSYGLIVELDAAFQPVASHHSRANGRRHGITSAIEQAGTITAASKGGDLILELPGAEVRP